MWVISAKFRICGYELPECDLTVALALLIIVGVAYALMLHTPVGG
jgi:hypothetical protein